MNIIANFIYFILGGFLPGILLMLVGFILCLTVVGISAGIQCFHRGYEMFMPFGHTVESIARKESKGYLALDVAWLVLLGWILVAYHLVLGIVFTVSIVGIPLGIQHFKMIPMSAMPMNHTLKETKPPKIIRQRKAKKALKKRNGKKSTLRKTSTQKTTVHRQSANTPVRKTNANTRKR